MAAPTATAEFTLRFGELARAVTVAYARPLLIITPALAILTALAVGSLPAGLAFLVVFPALTLGVTAGLSWVIGGRLRRPVTLTLDRNGVATATGPDDPDVGALGWSDFRDVRRSGDLYLLRLARGPGLVVVPRRGFVAGDETIFCRLVDEHLGGSTVSPP